MKKLLALIVLLVIFTSCTEKTPDICSGCKRESLYYNNATDWHELLHCRDTVYLVGPKGTIEKYPTNNK